MSGPLVKPIGIKEGTLADYKKPIPDPDPYTTAPFWEGALAGKLMLPRCADCNKTHWYPRILCPHCHSRNIVWYEASGEGWIHTFAVQHRAMGAWAEEVPFVTAYIDLKEGDRMFTVLRGVDGNKPEDIKVGAPVKIEFEPATDTVHIPFWRVVG
jgi:uncharacterized protein